MTSGEAVLAGCVAVTALFGAALLDAATRVKATISTAERRPAIVCTVEPDPSNRILEAGVMDENGLVLTSSDRQLNGDYSPKTFRFPLSLTLDCGFGEEVIAYCTLYDSRRQVAADKTNLHCPR